MLYTVDFKKVLILVGPAIIQGFADGEGFSLELDDDLYQKVTGADGDVSRSRRHGMAASAKITLMQTSPSNNILSAYAILDQQTNAGVVPLTVKDLLGTTALFSAYGWVKKTPVVAFGKEITNREWMIDLAGSEILVGGNLPMAF